ncbi:tape measure protein [Chromobacterium haemolyticum]|uniref:tape measure protein n=1 Tax=Chromobacterium haemolyticum TaxID=394935 RepID=UPI0009DAFB9A|nr:tape measure protein [Chromobacterium haemolyticum]
MANNNDMLIRMVMAGDASPFLKEVVAAEQKFGSALQGMSATAAKMELLGKAQESAKKAAAEFFKLKKESEAYQKAISMATGPTKDLEKALATTDKALDRAEKSMRRQIDSVQGLRKELSAAGVDSRNLAAAQAEMSAKVAATSRRVMPARRLDAARDVIGIRSNPEIEREIVQTQAAYARLAQSGTMSMSEQMRAAQAARARVAELRAELAGGIPTTSFLSTGAGKLAAMAAGFISLNAAIGLTKSILATAGEFETLRTQLNSVEKSAEKGKAAFQYVKDLAVNTPFQVNGLTKTYIQLKNFGLDPTAGSMQAVIDQASKLGGSQETLTRISLALGQAWSKEKLQGEEALQLIEAGVPVWELLGKKLNKTTAELQDLSQKGQLGRNAINALMEAMEQDAAGAAAAQMMTWNGVVSNAIDLWQQFLDDIGQAGLLEFAKKAITDLTEALNRMKETGELGQLVRDIAESLQALGQIAIGTAKFIVEHKEAIASMMAIYLGFKAKGLVVSLTSDLIKFAEAAGKASKLIKEVKNAETLGDMAAAAAGKKKTGSAAAAGSAAPILLEGGSAAKSVTTKSVSVVRTALLGMGESFTAFGAAVSAGIGAVLLRFSLIAAAAWGATKTVDLGRVAWEHYSVAVSGPKQHLESLQRTMAQTKGYSNVVVEGAAAVDQMTDASRKHYLEMLKLAQTYWRAKFEAEARKQWGSPEAKEAFNMAKIYSEAITMVNNYSTRRIAAEKDFKEKVEAVRSGVLNDLASKLAKEQQLYDKANDAFKDAVDRRKKHQEAWYGNKAVDPAKKAKDPAIMGVTDYYEGLSKANALGRKAQESQAQAAKTGKDADLRQAARDATATEKAFESLMDTINKLREAGKITEGEFNFFNDQAGRAQDGFDEKTVNKAKDQLQQAMEKVEALKQAAESIKKLQIGFDAAKGIADLDSLLSQFQAAAQSKPVKVPVQYVGPDGKYLSDARQTLGLPERPPSGVSVGGGTSDPQAEAARARQQQEAQNLAEARRQVGLPSGDAGASKLPIGFDQEAGKADLNKLLTDSQQLAQNQPVQVPVKYVSDGMPPPASLAEARRQVGLPEKGPGFSGGGWTGPGGKFEPAGIVHGGEFVQTQERMREPGALAFMWDFHRRGMGALQDWRGYANGGLVGAALPTFADRISLPDVGGLAQPAAKALGTLMLSLGGQQLAVSADPGEASDFMAGVRRLQLKS